MGTRLYQPCRFRIAMRGGATGCDTDHWKWINGYTAKISDPTVAVAKTANGDWGFHSVRSGMSMPGFFPRTLADAVPLLVKLNSLPALNFPESENPGEFKGDINAMREQVSAAVAAWRAGRP